MLLAALVAAPIPAALTLPSPHVLRVVHAMPLLAVTAAIGVVTVWDAICWAGQREHRRFTLNPRAGKAMQGVMLLGLLAGAIALPIELADRYDAYFDDYRTEGGLNFQEGAEPAIRYALDHQAEYDQIWVEDMTQGYAFVLFYGAWDPIDVHERLEVVRDPPWFNGVLKFDKYIFREAPEATLAGLPVLETFPIDGTLPPFEARGGPGPDGARVLVIRRSG